jgi:hypothetical protein
MHIALLRLRAFPVVFTHVLGLLLPQFFHHHLFNLLWRFGPFSGHGLPVSRFARPVFLNLCETAAR